MIFNIWNHGHIAVQLGPRKCPGPTLFIQPVCNMLTTSFWLLPWYYKSNPPSSVADAAEHVFCMTSFLFPLSLPRSRATRLENPCFWKRLLTEQQQTLHFSGASCRAGISLQQCKSHLQAELEESKHDLLASPVTKSCCAFQTRRKPHWQCTESQGIRWTEISICVPNERPLDLTGPKPVSSPAATPMS